MIWKTIIFIFDSPSESTNGSHSKARFLAQKKNWDQYKTFYLYGDLQTILKLYKNKYTLNSQPQFHLDKHSDLRTLRE